LAPPPALSSRTSHSSLPATHRRWPPLRQLQLGSHLVEFALRRSTRRSIGFMIDDNGLRVTAPKRITIGEIDNAIRAKQGWIVSKLLERRERKVQRQQRPRGLGRRRVLPYLGGDITLRLLVAAPPRQLPARDE
jgi:predicted metal-dependent hydrolase